MSATTGRFATRARTTATKPGQQRPDDGDEGAEEDEQPGAGGEEGTEVERAETDAERVDDREEDRRPGEGLQLAPGDATAGDGPCPHGAREEAHDPASDLRAVVAEEEEGEHRDRRAGQQVVDGEARLRGPSADLGLVDALADLPHEVGQLGGGLVDDEAEEPDDDGQRPEDGDDRGEPLGMKDASRRKSGSRSAARKIATRIG